MNLKSLDEHFSKLSEDDPMWAVLTAPGKKGNQWDPDEFFQTGRAEITSVINHLGERRWGPEQKERALDFGCGVGRLTQAMAEYFERADGVDISRGMIKLANELNQHPDSCEFHLNQAGDLALFEDASFDFIFSQITLQHMPSRFARGYIREFLRILRTGGVAVFQVPSGRNPNHPRNQVPFRQAKAWWYIRKKHLFNWIRQMRGQEIEAFFEMHSIPLEQVLRILKTPTTRLLEVRLDRSSGEQFLGYRYMVKKIQRTTDEI